MGRKWARKTPQTLYRTTELIHQAEEAALSQATLLTLIVNKFVARASFYSHLRGTLASSISTPLPVMTKQRHSVQ